MSVDEVLDDLQQRLHKAAGGLVMAASPDRPKEYARLMAKRDGVMLALDYTRAYR